MFQTGDAGSYLAGLATRYADELRTSFHEVLGQLEDLRLAEWSDQAPPPPAHPSLPVRPHLHTYANFPAHSVNYPPQSRSVHNSYETEPIYVPGAYAVRQITLEIVWLNTLFKLYFSHPVVSVIETKTISTTMLSSTELK